MENICLDLKYYNEEDPKSVPTTMNIKDGPLVMYKLTDIYGKPIDGEMAKNGWLITLTLKSDIKLSKSEFVSYPLK